MSTILFFIMLWAWLCLVMFTAKPATGFFLAPIVLLVLLPVQLLVAFIRGGVDEVMWVLEGGDL